uniref:Uncharacterized protein n=1 Tax=Chromera velia CCMP2878 TaxID=1169474 RepID=A0A0G4HJA1_9ALVE|mmetsp:Transcript_19684/g.39618  ORF Transcript_19684/g.39618 Transcript_19684/m.39618 type:complete len:163 (-) Transcript_19684:199-687(-)|eukprot:Cvel_28204.t1-p1 / transcript=Cvel_28204.t1 / gene=Cvel_28204 / organism=Chromera_velia_CCMP2878 / gene_product=hypothetical protein / transcript_product=hypothetical protein / location=Cvel_scaffold3647:9287-10022(-) / protein_length=162 / sequence_SO=supercontig / SO=protein_coding / is_pseudo=false
MTSFLALCSICCFLSLSVSGAYSSVSSSPTGSLDEEESGLSSTELLKRRVQLCMDFDESQAECEAMTKCAFDMERCVISPEFMKSMAESHCQTESRASILALARDLHREEMMDLSAISFLRTKTDINALCHAVTHAFFSRSLEQTEEGEEEMFWALLSQALS